jgi:hypothetical protein
MLLSLRDRTLINQRNSGDAQSKLSPLVTLTRLVVEVPAVRDKQVCLARVIFDRQVQQFPCSHCMLLGGRCELVTRRNAQRTPRGGLFRLLRICFKTLGDAKGIYSQALIPFQPGMRGTREKTPRCTSIKVRFGCVGLLTEWLILGDRTEAANYTKLQNDLRESISFVKGGKSQPCTEHVWTRWWLRRRLLWVSPTTIGLTPQSESAVLCKIYWLHVLARSCRGHVRDSVQEGSIGRCFGECLQAGGW